MTKHGACEFLDHAWEAAHKGLIARMYRGRKVWTQDQVCVRCKETTQVAFEPESMKKVAGYQAEDAPSTPESEYPPFDCDYVRTMTHTPETIRPNPNELRRQVITAAIKSANARIDEMLGHSYQLTADRDELVAIAVHYALLEYDGNHEDAYSPEDWEEAADWAVEWIGITENVGPLVRRGLREPKQDYSDADDQG